MKEGVELETESRRRLGEILLRQGILTQEHLNKALDKQRETGASLGRALMELGFATQPQILEALTRQCRIASIHLPDYTISNEAHERFDADLARSTLCVPLDPMGDILTVATQDPLDCLSLMKIYRLTGLKTKPVKARRKEVAAVLEDLYGQFEPYDPTSRLPEALSALREVCFSSLTTPFSGFNFDRFVVAEANDFAYAAAKAVTETPLEMYNPLYLEGEAGVGKTHLLHAMGNAFHQDHQDIRCFWAKLPTVPFERVHEWLDQGGRPCVLLLDNLEAVAQDPNRMAGLFSILKRTAEEDFIHLVLAGRIGPTDVPEFGSFWKEQFHMGVVIPMGHLERTGRLRFLESMVHREGVDVPIPCLERIEQEVPGNLSTLEAFLGLIRAFAWISGQIVTQELCSELLDLSHSETVDDGLPADGEDSSEKSETLRLLELIQDEVLSLCRSNALPMLKALRILETLQAAPDFLSKVDLSSLKTSMRELGWYLSWSVVSAQEDRGTEKASSGNAMGIEVVDLHVEEKEEIEEQAAPSAPVPSPEIPPEPTPDVSEEPSAEPLQETPPVEAPPEPLPESPPVEAPPEPLPESPPVEAPPEPLPESPSGSPGKDAEIVPTEASHQGIPSSSPPADMEEELLGERRRDAIREARKNARLNREARIAQALAMEVRKTLAEFKGMLLTPGERELIPQIEKRLEAVELQDSDTQREKLLQNAERAKEEVLRFSERIMERLQFEDKIKKRKAAVSRILNELSAGDMLEEVQDFIEDIRGAQEEAEQLLRDGRHAGAAELLEKGQIQAERAKTEGEKRLRRNQLLKQTEKVSQKLDHVEELLASLEEKGAATYLPEDLKKVYRLFTHASRALRKEDPTDALSKAEEAYSEAENLQRSLDEYIVTFQSKIEDVLLEGQQILDDLERRGAHRLIEDELPPILEGFSEARSLSNSLKMKEAERLSLETTSKAMVVREKALGLLGVRERTQQRLTQIEDIQRELSAAQLPSSFQDGRDRIDALVTESRSSLENMLLDKAASLADDGLKEAQKLRADHEQFQFRLTEYGRDKRDIFELKGTADALQAESRCPEAYREITETLSGLPEEADPERIEQHEAVLAQLKHDLSACISQAQQKRNQEFSERVSKLRSRISNDWDRVAQWVTKAVEESLKVEVREFLEKCDKAEGLGEMDQALQAAEAANEAMIELLDAVEARRTEERKQLDEVQDRVMEVLDRFSSEGIQEYAGGIEEELRQKARILNERWEREGAFEEVFVALRQLEEESREAVDSSLERGAEEQRKRRFEEVSKRLDDLEASAQRLEEKDILTYLPSLYRNVCQCIKAASQSLMEENLENALPALERAESIVSEMENNLEAERSREETEAGNLLVSAEEKLRELKASKIYELFVSEFQEIENLLKNARELFDRGDWRNSESACLKASEELLALQRKGKDVESQASKQANKIDELRSSLDEWSTEARMVLGDESVDEMISRVDKLQKSISQPPSANAASDVENLEQELRSFHEEMQERIAQLKERATGALEAVNTALEPLQGSAPKDFESELLTLRQRGKDLLADASYNESIEIFENILETVTQFREKHPEDREEDVDEGRVAVEEDISGELTGIRGALQRMKNALVREEQENRSELDSQLQSLKERMDLLASEADTDGLSERMDGARELLSQIQEGAHGDAPTDELLERLDDLEQCVEILENQKLLREEISLVSREIESILDRKQDSPLPAQQEESLQLCMDLLSSAQEAYQLGEWEAGWVALNQTDEVLKELKAFLDSQANYATTSFSTDDIQEALQKSQEQEMRVGQEGNAVSAKESEFGNSSEHPAASAFGLHWGPLSPQLLNTYHPGDKNQPVLDILKEMVDTPGSTRNPCILVGDKRTGKTHLLNGVANALQERHREAKVLCMDALDFGKAFLNAMTDGSVDALRGELQEVDALLLDDIINLGDIDAIVQDNLVKLVPILVQYGKQVLFTAKSDPIHSRRLKPEFRESLKVATQLEIRLLEVETRLDIIRDLCKEWNVDLSDEIKEQLASSLGNNLHGYSEAIQRVLSYSYLTGQDISKKLVKKICKEVAALH